MLHRLQIHRRESGIGSDLDSAYRLQVIQVFISHHDIRIP